MLHVSWGPPVRGREERGLEVFGEALGLLGRMQQDGRIESFDVGLMRPNDQINGFITIHGSAAQMAALKDDAEFMANTMDAQMIVERVSHIEGFSGEGIAQMMEMYRAAVAKVPQLT
jgi:hypothetical protein